jgi:hypothetical protein
MYLKITNAEENHHGLQYVDGLNIDPVPFAREGSCCAGGIYFTTPEYICDFISMGIYVREVTVPEDAEIVRDGDKWRASKVILSQRKDLRDVETWKWLVEIGANIHARGDCCFRHYVYKNNFEIVKYLVENGADIHSYQDEAFRSASEQGNLEIIKCLIEHDANIHAGLMLASAHGYIEIVKYLIEHGADIHANNDDALRYASARGHIEIVKYLIEHGADIHAENDDALRYASAHGHLDVVNYLTGL